MHSLFAYACISLSLCRQSSICVCVIKSHDESYVLLLLLLLLFSFLMNIFSFLSPSPTSVPYIRMITHTKISIYFNFIFSVCVFASSIIIIFNIAYFVSIRSISIRILLLNTLCQFRFSRICRKIATI